VNLRDRRQHRCGDAERSERTEESKRKEKATAELADADGPRPEPGGAKAYRCEPSRSPREAVPTKPPKEFLGTVTGQQESHAEP
jgi:hypothetical protein